MPVVFSKNTGRVISVADSVAEGAISLGNVDGEGGKISFSQHKTIITQVGLSAAGNYQFLHTSGNDVYVYGFGDRMGQVTLHGLSFSADCAAGKDEKSQHGFELLYKWYAANRIAVRRDPVTVTIGLETTFQGFLTALTATVQDPMHRTIQFQMTIATLPEAKDT